MLTKKDQEALKKARTDKQLKKIFKGIASKDPDSYFPTKELRALGYFRKQCDCCKTYFWTTLKDREVCGDPECSGGFNIVVDNPSKVKLSFIGVWNKIVEILEPRGYKPIKRYPCVARWNPTSEFTIASISAFQPYVITGEVEPPAKKLLIPQFCLRFNDIENVGITGSHNTGFVMIGQHFFGSPEEWNQGEFFNDIYDFIHLGVGLDKNEITIHEDSWAGGGSFGCSLEFFSRGIELFNQVYTMFEQTPKGPQELKLKVLDMGLGQDRVAWFSQGTPNMYEAIFPKVLSKLRKIAQIKLDLSLYNEFSKYSAYLNIDEVEDMNVAWQKVAGELDMGVEVLRQKILPMTALYSIAEHSRSLLFAVNDGKLPSNVGGGYNLRVIFRRAIAFIDHFGWKVDLADVCEWHAEELKDIFPEVSDHLDEIREILDVEKDKYYISKREAKKILKSELKKGEITVEKLIEWYDSKGINPEMVKAEAVKLGKKVIIPDDFYSQVVARHEQIEQIHATKKEMEYDLHDIPETKSLYYYDYTDTVNDARVLKIIDNIVVLDQSIAYPTSGGQLHDVGMINGQKFNDVYKQNNHVLHVLDEKPNFKVDDTVKVEIDKNWRTQLSQHHTATHIVNAAAREILGDHVNQAGAKKTMSSSHLDITHYENIPSDKLKLIEEKANQIVEKAIDLNLSFIPRSEAEKRYGMKIYQGGAVPGKFLRIVEIPGIDVEACGGTHLNNTSETGNIKIINSQKISDGVIRLTFTAGKATKELLQSREEILTQMLDLFNISPNFLVGRVRELFNKRKKINKILEKGGDLNEQDLTLNSKEPFTGEILSEISKILNTSIDTIPKKLIKLYNEWKTGSRKVKMMQTLLSDENIANLVNQALKYNDYKLILKSFEEVEQKDLQSLSKKVVRYSDKIITIFVDKTQNGIILMGMLAKIPAKNADLDMGQLIKDCVEKFGGNGGGKKDYGQGFIGNTKIKTQDILSSIKERLGL